MKIFAHTDIGRRRSGNQDCYRVARYGDEVALCVVCDGMGGALGGAEASRIASDAFIDALDPFIRETLASTGVPAGDAPAGDKPRDMSDTQEIYYRPKSTAAAAAGAATAAGAVSAPAVSDAATDSDMKIASDENAYTPGAFRYTGSAARESTVRAALTAAASAANDAVYRASADDASLRGMGTTLVAALIVCGELYAANIGDSRLYLCDGDEIRQVSHDHSYVQYLVDIGKLTPEEALTSTSRNIITRAVGTDTAVETDVFRESFPSGSVALLCSDGLTNHVDPEEIAAILRAGNNPAKALVDKANERGGSDNITALAVYSDGDGDGDGLGIADGA